MNITLNNSSMEKSLKYGNSINKKLKAGIGNSGKEVNSQLKALQQQKESLQKQMKELQKNAAANQIKNGDNGVKVQGGKDPVSEQLKQLQGQLEDVNKQISKVKTDAIKKTVENSKLDFKNEEDFNKDDFQKRFTNFTTNMNNIGIQKSVKRKLTDRSRILETEIKLDKARGVNTKGKEKQLSHMKENIEHITERVNVGSEKVHKNKAAERVNKVLSDKYNVKNDKAAKRAEKISHNQAKYDNNLKGNLVDARV